MQLVRSKHLRLIIVHTPTNNYDDEEVEEVHEEVSKVKEASKVE